MRKRIIALSFFLQKNLPAVLGRPLFRLWWSKHRKKAPTDLVVIVDGLLASPSFHLVSSYWLFLARRNIAQIVSKGLNDFKQTIARDYFVLVNWKRSGYYENLFKEVDKSDQVFLSNVLKQHEYFGLEASISYNVFTLLLLNHVRKLPSANRYLMLEESPIGTPATLNHEGKNVSSDLLNSILDYDSIFTAINEQDIGVVMEVGGGYGRNAYCNIHLLPKLKKYIMVDIPPALFLAQHYISSVFPNKKVFKARPFSSFSDIEKEFNEAELVFLLPEQIALLPGKTIDLVIAIDCLHEMDKAQVIAYFNEFDRVGKRFYFKCWRETDKNFFQWKEYPIKKSWKEIVNRPTFVPAQYFESIYSMGE